MRHEKFGFGGWIAASYGEYSNPFPMNSDEYWMAEAFSESVKEMGKSSPNPNVGCAVVKGGSLLAKGATEAYGGLHGERLAFSMLDDQQIKGATIYVTLEPCSHHGKQPPCAELLVEKNIARCVIAMKDPFAEVDGKGIKLLKENGIEVTVGVLEEEARSWHLPFLFSLQENRPLMIAKWAQTLDGHLADDQDCSQWITGPEARSYTHALRQKFDCIMVGSQTVLRDVPSLDARDCNLPIHRSPIKIIIDPKGDLLNCDTSLQEKLSEKTFAKEASIYCGPSIKGSWLQSCAGKVAYVPLEGYLNHNTLREMSKSYMSLRSLALQSILVEGGASLLNRLIEDDLVDAYSIFQRPSFLGASKNRIGQRPKAGSRALSELQGIHLLGTTKLGQDLVMEGLSEPLAKRLMP